MKFSLIWPPFNQVNATMCLVSYSFREGFNDSPSDQPKMWAICLEGSVLSRPMTSHYRSRFSLDYAWILYLNIVPPDRRLEYLHTRVVLLCLSLTIYDNLSYDIKIIMLLCWSNDSNTYLRILPMHATIEQPLLVYKTPSAMSVGLSWPVLRLSYVRLSVVMSVVVVCV